MTQMNADRVKLSATVESRAESGLAPRGCRAFEFHQFVRLRHKMSFATSHEFYGEPKM
jgi:hypothetical protein